MYENGFLSYQKISVIRFIMTPRASLPIHMVGHLVPPAKWVRFSMTNTIDQIAQPRPGFMFRYTEKTFPMPQAGDDEDVRSR